MRLAILTRQIGHYHDARYRAAARRVGRLTVIATAGEGAFEAFAATGMGDYDRIVLNRTKPTYDAAVRSGRLAPALRAALERARPDAVAVAGWGAAESAIALRWARERGVPAVMMTESQKDDASRASWREWLKRRLLARAGAALVGGPPHADYVAALGMPRERIFLGYDAVDVRHFGREADRAARPAGMPERYLLASSRFVAKKNLPILIAAHGSVFGRTGPALVLLGDGPERAVVEAARSHHPDPSRVLLPGFRGYADLPALYAHAEGFVHVPTHEQWGLVVSEAMACGTPVLASAPCGAARTLIEDGSNGLVCEADQDAVERGLARLWAMGPEGRHAMGARGRATVADWGPERFAEGLAKAVRAAGDARRTKPGPVDRLILSGLSRALPERVA